MAAPEKKAASVVKPPVEDKTKLPAGDLIEEPPASLPAPSLEDPKKLDDDLPPAAPSSKDKTKRSQSLRPVYRSATRGFRNVLNGQVFSQSTSRSEPGVLIVASSRTGMFVDRTATSNEDGRFTLRLPDGDWTLKVTAASGRVYSVSNLTASGGEIYDEHDEDATNLAITR